MAHWIIDDRGFGGMFYTCSNCKSVFSNICRDDPGRWDTCKDCGARFTEEAVYTDELENDETKKAVYIKDIEKAMRESKNGIGGKRVSLVSLTKTLLKQQIELNEFKLAELRGKE